MIKRIIFATFIENNIVLCQKILKISNLMALKMYKKH